jgi:hypothetical protein
VTAPALPEPSPDAAPVPTFRLRAPADVIGIVPGLLGFHPEESVVLLCLQGPRRQLLVTLRADLPSRSQSEPVREFVDRAAKVGAEAVIAVVYSEKPRGGDGSGLPQRRLVRHLTTACAARDVTLVDVLLVGQGRWWSYWCSTPSCCPPEGTPVHAEPASEVVRFQAEKVARGTRVWSRRTDLAASIAVPDAARIAELYEEFDDTERDFVRRAAAGDIDALRAETVSLLRDAHVAFRDTGHEPPTARAARIAIGLRDVRARDEVLGWAGGAHAGAFVALLTALVRVVPPPEDAPIVTVLAWAAYQNGDGALAQCALDRALTSDPTYNLAVLLQHALDRALVPSALAEVFSGQSNSRA